jgi:hypothetical protein
LRKSVPRFSAKNLRQTKNLSGRSVGEATQVCLVVGSLMACFASGSQ